MDENEFLTFDRIQKIQSVVGKYGEENFCISWSGGKDSQVMSKLFDLAIPDNTIPRVYADTGLDLKIMRDFVNEQKKKDDRIVIIKPSVPVKPMLEKEGYPFKSKKHARIVDVYQRLGWRDPVLRYIGKHPSKKNWTGTNHCPDILLYQFSEDFELRVSDKCCLRMKEEPLNKWAKENGKPHHVIGVMRSEGGRRSNVECMRFRGDKLKAFQPLAPMTKEWEDWFIEKYEVEMCDIYKPPYNFNRTGCKGCPFAVGIQHELDILEKYFPADRRHAEALWKPVYKEYRRIGYRLNQYEQTTLDFDDEQ